jgi:hypothetical protein
MCFEGLEATDRLHMDAVYRHDICSGVDAPLFSRRRSPARRERASLSSGGDSLSSDSDRAEREYGLSAKTR